MRHLAFTILLWACTDPGQEIVDEFSGQDLQLGFTLPSMVVTGASASGSVYDKCRAAQNDDCGDNNWMITSVSCSGAILNCFTTSPADFAFSADTTLGHGTFSVSAQAGNVTTSGSASIAVREPSGALVSPSCSNPRVAQAPYRISTAVPVSVGWRLQIDGMGQYYGDNGANLSSAPGFTFVEKEFASATYTSPATAGTYTVSATLGMSMFDYEVYTPDAVTSLELVPPAPGGSGTLIAYSLAGLINGERVCDDPGPKTVTTVTPDVCKLVPAGNASLEVDTTQTRSQFYVKPITAGTCQLRATMANSAVIGTYDVELP